MKTKSFTILNVDDSVEYLRTHSHFLKSKGYTVLEATTGNECLRLTKKHKPDLILLDVVLPDIYGIEVCRQIKTNVDTKQTLILLISGYEIGSDAQVRGFEAGADDYLVKPISKNELLAHVRVMERIKRSEDELREVALLLEQRVKERTNAIEKINQELQNEIAKHKRAEEALRESEQRFQVLTENSPVGIFQTDAKGSTIYVNPRWCQISGLSKEEAMGSGWLSAVHSEDKKKLSNGWKKATQAHDSSIADYRFVHKDGTITWVIGQAIPERNSKNKIVGYVGTITDINEHKRAEEELSALTIRQQAILAAVPDIIMEVDNNKIYTWVNKAGIDFFGKDVIGKEASYYFEGTQDTYDVVHPLFIGDENTIYVESWQRRKDGEKRLLAWWCRVLKDRSGNVIGALSSARDITERKRAEEALRESEEKFRILFETMPNGFYRSTPEGYYVDVNPAFVKMLGYDSKEELLNVYIPTDIYVRAIERDVFVRENEDFVNNLEVYRLKTKDGRIIWLEENARYIKDENGRVIYNEGICRDITERKHVEEALLQEQYLMNMLMDNVPDHIYFKDTDSRFIRINKDHAKKFGLSNPTQATGKTDFDFFTEEHARPAFEDEQTIIRTGKPIVGIEEKETWPDGQETWVSTTKMPLRDKEGNIIGTFGISRDITERKRAEEQIAMLAHAVRSINECVSITDTNNNIVFVNQAFLNTYGYTEQDLLGKNISLVRSSKISDEEIEKIRLSTLEGSWHGELMNKRKDGSEFPIFLSTTTVHDNEGKPIALIGVATDITERKQAEETLSLLNHTIKSTSECISITDLNNKILFVNQAFLKTYGYIEEEVVGKPIYIVRAEKIENKDIVFDTTLQGSWHGELLNRKKDGTVFPVSLSTSVVHNEKKQPIALVGVAVDITERKQADEALRESEAKLIEAMKIARLGTWEYDVVRDQFTFNDQFYKLLHTTAEREGGYIMSSAHYAQKFVYPDDVSVVGMEIQKALETTDPDYYSELDHRIICVDGEIGYITVHIRIVKDAQGRTVKTHGVNQDITERKRAEEALQESELRFRSLYENATIGIYRTTPDGNILLANPALVKMLGYTSFHKLAERNLEKDGFESSSQRKEFLEKIERDGEVHGYDSKWMRQDDSAIFVLESARAIRDSQGKTLYYDGTVEDITERKLLEEQMRQVQKLEGLGTLAGGIAHDFNNILGIILAYITSAKRFKDDAKKLDLAVDTIVKAVERGKTLVQQILTFARKSDTEFGAVNVNDVVMEIMAMIFETFPKVLTYAQNFDKSITFINADRSQLHQALLNLCVNARDAMPSGGLLTINTRLVSSISLRNQYPDAAASSYVCIEVSDTGEGMTPETRKRIFEPFFTTKGIGKGTGLGLAVVFGVVQTHKGFIDVESELGKGTTFRFYLPVLQVAEPISVKDEETLEDIPGGTETLLVVEDEEMLMMSLRMVLVEKGYKVLSAEDGLTALKIYQERKTDIALVLTDLGLPTITGLEVCQRIKTINPNEHIILATGFLDPEMKSEFLKAGVQHFLYKPYDLKKVLKVVREVLDGK